jgi:hypothetical protein
MSNFTEQIKENTSAFYFNLEQEAEKQNQLYEKLFKKSKMAILENIKMFDELGIVYTLTNLKGVALLETEVLIFKEEDKPKLILNLRGDCKTEEGKDKFYSSYVINAGVDSIIKQTPFIDEFTLSIDYSNEILGLLEKRPLEEFLNNFDLLYSQKPKRK